MKDSFDVKKFERWNDLPFEIKVKIMEYCRGYPRFVKSIVNVNIERIAVLLMITHGRLNGILYKYSKRILKDMFTRKRVIDFLI